VSTDLYLWSIVLLAVVFVIALVLSLRALRSARAFQRMQAEKIRSLKSESAQLSTELDSKRTKITALARQLHHLPAASRSLIAPAALALSDEEFARIWRNADPATPLFLAVKQIILDAVSRVSDPRLAVKPELTAAAGGLDHLLALAQNLETALQKPEPWTRKGRREAQVTVRSEREEEED
jgi:hypothetical protein